MLSTAQKHHQAGGAQKGRAVPESCIRLDNVLNCMFQRQLLSMSSLTAQDWAYGVYQVIALIVVGLSAGCLLCTALGAHCGTQMLHLLHHSPVRGSYKQMVIHGCSCLVALWLYDINVWQNFAQPTECMTVRCDSTATH